MILQQKTAWSACPNCYLDLAIRPRGARLLIDKCPHCGVAIIPVWWQRCLVSGLALTLTYGVPAAMGIQGLMPLLLAGLIFVFPALVTSYTLVFKVVPPKYVWKNEVLTLFQRP
jgi:hypothetical protein